MSLIQISNLTFGYDGSYDLIFDNTSFQFDTDWRLGFVGRNGRGKTTLLHLLTASGRVPDAVQPDPTAESYEYRGTITASVKFDYFPFPVPDPSKATFDAAYEAVGDMADNNIETARWELERELLLLDLPEETWHRPFETLSHGERTKALLAALFLRHGHFPLIDEPTDHLDEHARAAVGRYLRSKKGFLLVSHDRKLLDECVDHVLSINRGGIELQNGNFSSWFAYRTQRDAYELAENRRINKEIKRLETTAREKAEWSDKIEAGKIGGHVGDRGYVGHMAAKAMKRSKTIERRVDRELEEQSQLLKNIEKADSLKVTPLTHHNHRLLELRDVTIYSDNTRIICHDVSFTVEHGERVALKGANGSGKSSLIKLILAQAGVTNLTTLFHRGILHTPNRLIISYVSQDTAGLSGDLTAFAQEHGLDDTLFKTILRKLDFTRVQFDKDMRSFSSGQKKKALLAKSLCERAHIYIWDEPLNFVDVLSRMQIEELILSSEPTMLFVEHDRTFTEKIATKTVSLDKN